MAEAKGERDFDWYTYKAEVDSPAFTVIGAQMRASIWVSSNRLGAPRTKPKLSRVTQIWARLIMTAVELECAVSGETHALLDVVSSI